MKRTAHKTTRICGYDADHISVRGKDLVKELMGKATFSEMILLHLTGVLPARRQVAILDAVLVTIMEHGLMPAAIAIAGARFPDSATRFTVGATHG